MENYIADYVSRDIRGLFPRLNIHHFRRFLSLLAQYSGHQMNMSSIARALGVSVPTVKDYLDIIHQTFLWRNLESYDRNSLKKVQKANKEYFRDQGLLHYFLKINDLDQLLVHPVAGFSFESIVIEEIIRGLQATMATQYCANPGSIYMRAKKPVVNAAIPVTGTKAAIDLARRDNRTPRFFDVDN